MKKSELFELIRLNKEVEEHGKWYGKARVACIKPSFGIPISYEQSRIYLKRVEQAHREYVFDNEQRLNKRLDLLKKWSSFYRNSPEKAAKLAKNVLDCMKGQQ